MARLGGWDYPLFLCTYIFIFFIILSFPCLSSFFLLVYILTAYFFTLLGSWKKLLLPRGNCIVYLRGIASLLAFGSSYGLSLSPPPGICPPSSPGLNQSLHGNEAEWSQICYIMTLMYKMNWRKHHAIHDYIITWSCNVYASTWSNHWEQQQQQQSPTIYASCAIVRSPRLSRRFHTFPAPFDISGQRLSMLQSTILFSSKFSTWE